MGNVIRDRLRRKLKAPERHWFWWLRGFEFRHTLNKRFKKLDVGFVDTSYVALSIRKIVLLIHKFCFFAMLLRKKKKSQIQIMFKCFAHAWRGPCWKRCSNTVHISADISSCPVTASSKRFASTESVFTLTRGWKKVGDELRHDGQIKEIR